ncbi:hypothetical protein M885DRAFT_619955 [Pelagophyceae sp. CCMP2097]|nr:hypothetical protein M885DRAFT_619955 [Pelagophyceae sp. CCMP2097]|mmetsp:Transcript_15341/g.51622  ORF Transcript_15341/g.51622 Transcript_15341/m.51622 type:complete len:188 (-) Transcript_15341:274-837(-)
MAAARLLFDVDELGWPRSLARLLCAADVISLAASTKRLHDTLHIGLVSVSVDRNITLARAADFYSALRWQGLPLSEDCEVHTVFLRFRWQDQGWGNQKGMLSVIRGAGSAPDDYAPWTSDVAAGIEPAPHENTAAVLAFRAAAGETYSIFARCGGGGGHALNVQDLDVRQLAFMRQSTADGSAAAGA